LIVKNIFKMTYLSAVICLLPTHLTGAFMKHAPIKTAAIALIASITLCGFAVAESVATQPAVATPPAMLKMPEMPKMPDMPKPPIPDMSKLAHPTPASTSPSATLTDHVMHMMMKTPENATPSTKAFIEANTKMHQGMAIQFTGNADADFVKGMIPHHQGAVDMAKIVLQYGKDPEIKKFAESIIKAQSTEIEFMNAWLKKNTK
jgi:hypothetical protein